GLSHDPDGRRVGRFAPTGFEEAGVVQGGGGRHQDGFQIYELPHSPSSPQAASREAAAACRLAQLLKPCAYSRLTQVHPAPRPEPDAPFWGARVRFLAGGPPRAEFRWPSGRCWRSRTGGPRSTTHHVRLSLGRLPSRYAVVGRW